MQFQKLDPTIKGIAQSLGQEHAGPAYELAETALSGRGDLSREYALEVAKHAAAATARSGDKELAKQLVTDTLRLAQNLPEGQRDPKKLIGAQLGGEYRRLIGAMPGIAQRMAAGASFQESAALFEAFSIQAVDEGGEASSRAAMTLEQELDKAAANHPRLERNRAFQARWRGMTPGEKLEFVRGPDKEAMMMRLHLLGAENENPEEARKALHHPYKAEGALSGRAKTKRLMRAMIDPRSKQGTYELYKKLGEEIPDLDSEENVAAYKDFASAGPQAAPLAKLKQADVTMKGALAARELSNTDMAAAGVFLESLDKLADLEKDSALRKSVRSMQGSFNAGFLPLPDQMRNMADMLDVRAAP